MAERRVAPPAVGTVALACGHCGLPFKSALLGPGMRLWWRREGATVLVVGFESARFWCRRCTRETVIADECGRESEAGDGVRGGD
jgi:hypothetical protein